MKSTKLTVLALSALAMIFSAIAFINNVVAIIKWWTAFQAAGGDTAALEAFVGGFLPCLDWTVVDYSAVTTLIPLIGFTCTTVAAWRLWRGERLATENFPFFRGSDQLHIALGLFGTLWGIIVIGYFQLDKVTMSNLMQCLHTALFSTLMAVVWVFLIDRPLLRPFFLRLLEKCDLAETDNGDLAAAVDRLISRLGAASDAFDRRQREFDETFAKRQGEYAEAFDQRQREFETAFAKRQSEYEATFAKHQQEFESAFEARRADYAAHYEKRLADYEREFETRQKEYVEFFTRRIAELEKRAADSEAKLKAVAVALHG